MALCFKRCTNFSPFCLLHVLSVTHVLHVQFGKLHTSLPLAISCFAWTQIIQVVNNSVPRFSSIICLKHTCYSNSRKKYTSLKQLSQQISFPWFQDNSCFQISSESIINVIYVLSGCQWKTIKPTENLKFKPLNNTCGRVDVIIEWHLFQ
jgi:hypothetical protein